MIDIYHVHYQDMYNTLNNIEEVLYSFSLTPGTLVSVGDSLVVDAHGHCAGTATVKQVNMWFGGTRIGRVPYPEAECRGGWRIQARIVRTGETSQVTISSGEVYTTFFRTMDSTPDENFSAPVTITVTAKAPVGEIVMRGLVSTVYRI